MNEEELKQKYNIGKNIANAIEKGDLSEENLGEPGKEALAYYREISGEKAPEMDKHKYNIGKNLAGMIERGEQSEEKLGELGKEALAYYREISGEKAPEMDKHKYNIGKNLASRIEMGEQVEENLPQLGREALAYYRENKDKVEPKVVYEVSKEEQRLEEERLAAEKLAEAERLAEEQRLEAERQEAERLAEEQRLEAERLAAEKLAEAERLAEEQRLEAERQEAERLAEEQRLEEERLAAEKLAEAERLAEEQRVEEERLAAEKLAEAERLAEEQKLEEENKQEEKKKSVDVLQLEVKKITRYDEYTVNEFVRDLVKARSDIEKANEELDSRDESVKEEKKKIKSTLSKWEKEKERIRRKLESKQQENEAKINENQQGMLNLENEVKANEEKMQDLDQESEEYVDLEKANNEIMRKMSRVKGSITRYEKKINNLIEIIGNLEEENVLEGLKPPRTIDKVATRPGRSVRKVNNDEKQKEENEQSEVIDEIGHIEEQPVNEEVVKLEEEIKKSAERMKAYRESGNYEQEAAERAYYNSLVSQMNDLKTERESEDKKEEIVQDEVAKLEEEIRKSAERMKAYRESGNYEQEAAEHAYYNSLVSKMNELKPEIAKTDEEKPGKVKTDAETSGKVKTDDETSGKIKTDDEKKSEVKWHPKLTQEQIDELIAEGLEPGDNEYNLYLWNHGINPFEEKMKPKTEPDKATIDEVLEKYKNDGFGKNAFGWYFNPWKDEFDEEYDPHNDPEYNEKLKEEKAKVKTTELVKPITDEKEEIEVDLKKLNLRPEKQTVAKNEANLPIEVKKENLFSKIGKFLKNVWEFLKSDFKETWIEKDDEEYVVPQKRTTRSDFAETVRAHVDEKDAAKKLSENSQFKEIEDQEK